MKNCTNHFLKRWVERIVEITTEREINEYISKNREQIIEHANKTFEYAEHVYTGQIGDNITRNYFIKDDIVFVANTTNDAFVTIYKVDLGFTEELNSTVRKGLMKEIRKLSEEKEEIELYTLEEAEKAEHEIATINEQIEILRKKIVNLQRTRDFKNEEVKQIKRRTLNIGLDIKKHVLTLVNSKDYKDDLQSIK